MIKRILTDGEKFQIAYALKKYATRAEDNLAKVLGGIPDIEDGRAPKQLGDIQIREAEMIRASINSMKALADFILRNKVTVDCTITIPEQF